MPSDSPDPFDAFEQSELSELVSVNADKVAGWEARGIDPRPHRAIIFKHVNGKAMRCEGNWPVSEVNHDFLRSQWGGGTYTVQIHNVNNQILAKNPATVNGPASGTAASAPTTLPGSGQVPQSDADLGRWALMKLLERSEAPRQDSLRDVIGAMASLVQLQVTSLKAQMETRGAPVEQKESVVEKLVLAALPKLIDRGFSPPQKNGHGTFEEFFGALKFGMALAGTKDKGSRKNPDDDDATKWIEIIPQVVDSIGPGLVATIAQATLPPEKAQAVVDTIQSHMKARETEAAKEPTVVEAEGIPMP